MAVRDDTNRFYERFETISNTPSINRFGESESVAWYSYLSLRFAQRQIEVDLSVK